MTLLSLFRISSVAETKYLPGSYCRRLGMTRHLALKYYSKRTAGKIRFLAPLGRIFLIGIIIERERSIEQQSKHSLLISIVY